MLATRNSPLPRSCRRMMRRCRCDGRRRSAMRAFELRPYPIRRRRAFTLVETVVAIGFGSVILGLAVGSVALLMGMHGSQRRSLNSIIAQTRLASQFREDGRAATEWTPPADETTGICQFQMPDGAEVTYRYLGDAVVRDRRTGNEHTGRERFVLGPDARCSVTQTGNRGDALVVSLLRLTIDVPWDTSGSQIRHRTNVLVSLGADQRFATSPE